MIASGGLRERGKQRRAERILGAALELLREQPDQPLTVDRIAARAEVAPATVFNLVGTRDEIWAALAHRAFSDLEERAERLAEDPQDRARAAVDLVMRAVIADAPVFRALLSAWSESGKVLQHDLTDDLADCLAAAHPSSGVKTRRLATLVGAGLNGAVHQWASGLISDRELRARSRDLVDTAFVAARGACIDPEPPRWRLGAS
jgi:AcrR family transcriptional regulator